MPIKLLKTWPLDRTAPPIGHLILAHGAGAPMDSEFMHAIAHELSACAVAVSRFEFSYMAGRRTGGGKRPPPRVDKLMLEYSAVVDHMADNNAKEVPLLIGGKSMGGRIASMIADAHLAPNQISGLVCLGYPFHPDGKPEKLRTAHLRSLQCPALIVQGTRDKLGDQDDVGGYDLSESISLKWLTDGDHDFKPRKVSGITQSANINVAVKAIAEFAASL